MNKFILPILLVFVELIGTGLFSLPWQPADTLLACVVLYAFFHSFDFRQNIFFALWCGFVRMVFGLEDFAFVMLAYLLCGLAVMMLARFLYRFNWLFVFPIVFCVSLMATALWTFFKMGPEPSATMGFLFLARACLSALGTAAVAYPLYHLAKKCVPELIG